MRQAEATRQDRSPRLIGQFGGLVSALRPVAQPDDAEDDQQHRGQNGDIAEGYLGGDGENLLQRIARKRFESRFSTGGLKTTVAGAVDFVPIEPFTSAELMEPWGDPFVAQWKAFYENVTENKAPKTGPSDFVQDLELFAEMARLMREP